MDSEDEWDLAYNSKFDCGRADEVTDTVTETVPDHTDESPIDEDVNSNPQGRKKDPRGRKKGSYGSAVLKGAIRELAHTAEHAPGSIEHARECKKQKHMERKEQLASIVESIPSSSNMSNTSLKALQYVESFGGKMSTFLSVGDVDLHHLLCETLTQCYSKGFQDERDTLVHRQLEDSMSHTSVQALCKELHETRIGDRCLSIASCFLLLTGSCSKFSSAFADKTQVRETCFLLCANCVALSGFNQIINPIIYIIWRCVLIWWSILPNMGI